MRFRFEKLYADLVTPDGAVCIAYVATLRWGPIRHAFAGAELLGPDGSLETLRATGAPRDWLVPNGSSDQQVRFPCEAGEFRLRYRPELDEWRPAGPPPSRGLEWWVQMPRAAGELSWPLGPGRRLAGLGYVDRVRLERPLRRIRLTRLEWGRIHMGETTLVYTGVSFAGRPRWQRAARWERGRDELRVRDAFELVRSNGKLALRLRPGCLEAGVVLTPFRRLHRGPAIEAAPESRAFERAVARVLAGPLVDDRWISRAHPAGGDPRLGGWAVHEVVMGGDESREPGTYRLASPARPACGSLP